MPAIEKRLRQAWLHLNGKEYKSYRRQVPMLFPPGRKKAVLQKA
jgi:protein-S-isoprenylcysteine O-methyltransferase Ste14